MTYTEVPPGKGRCPDCGKVRSCTWTGNGALIVHGPRAARCPGSGRLPVPWLAATGLPRWDDLTDLDKGAALLLVLEHGPNLCVSEARLPVYLDDPVLTGLDPQGACRHAAAVLGCDTSSARWERAAAVPGAQEAARLSALARAAREVRAGEELAWQDDARARRRAAAGIR
jgi:hypothetical protein